MEARLADKTRADAEVDAIDDKSERAEAAEFAAVEAEAAFQAVIGAESDRRGEGAVWASDGDMPSFGRKRRRDDPEREDKQRDGVTQSGHGENGGKGRESLAVARWGRRGPKTPRHGGQHISLSCTMIV
jgi:hypothetical protein